MDDWVAGGSRRPVMAGLLALGVGLLITVGVGSPGHPALRGTKDLRGVERTYNVGTTTGSLVLGLNVSRTLAEHMGGSLDYRREEAVTVFELRLPRAMQTGDEPPKDAHGEPADLSRSRAA